MITMHGIEVEFNSAVIDRVIGRTLVVESALTLTLDRQLHLRLWVESIPHGEPQGRADWRQHPEKFWSHGHRCKVTV